MSDTKESVYFQNREDAEFIAASLKIPCEIVKQKNKYVVLIIDNNVRVIKKLNRKYH